MSKFLQGFSKNQTPLNGTLPQPVLNQPSYTPDSSADLKTTNEVRAALGYETPEQLISKSGEIDVSGKLIEFDQDNVGLLNQAAKEVYDLAVEDEKSGKASDYRKPLEMLNRLISANPNLEWAHFDRGICKVKLGRYEEAILDFTEESLKHTHGPGFYRSLYERGSCYFRLKSYEMAKKDFELAKQFNPDQDILDHCNNYISSADAAIEAIKIDALNKEAEEAEEAFDLAEKDKENGKTPDYEKPLEMFERIIAADPNYEDAYFNRGMCKSQLGRYEEAILDFNAELSKHTQGKGFYLSLYERGVCYSKLGFYELAKKDFVLAKESNPDQDTLNRCNLYIPRTDAAIEAIKNDALIREAKEAYNLAAENEENGKTPDYIKPLETLDRVIAAKANLKYAHFYRGTSKLKLGRYEEAILDFTEELKHEVGGIDDMSSLYARGACYFALGSYELAKADFLSAKKIAPNQKYSDKFDEAIASIDDGNAKYENFSWIMKHMTALIAAVSLANLGKGKEEEAVENLAAPAVVPAEDRSIEVPAENPAMEMPEVSASDKESASNIQFFCRTVLGHFNDDPNILDSVEGKAMLCLSIPEAERIFLEITKKDPAELENILTKEQNDNVLVREFVGTMRDEINSYTYGPGKEHIRKRLPEERRSEEEVQDAIERFKEYANLYLQECHAEVMQKALSKKLEDLQDLKKVPWKRSPAATVQSPEMMRVVSPEQSQGQNL